MLQSILEEHCRGPHNFRLVAEQQLNVLGLRSLIQFPWTGTNLRKFLWQVLEQGLFDTLHQGTALVRLQLEAEKAQGHKTEIIQRVNVPLHLEEFAHLLVQF